MSRITFIIENRQSQWDTAEIRFNDERDNRIALVGVDVS